MPGLNNPYSPSGILLIDGDAIPWMIGWHHREHEDTSTVLNAVDRWFRELLLLAGTEDYRGILASSHGVKCFRYTAYKYKRYKGNRVERPDWYVRWFPVISSHLKSVYGFTESPPELETDDVISAVAELAGSDPEVKDRVYICSPDKDLRQIPGRHVDYTKDGGQAIEISEEQAIYNWCTQMIMGDSSDNIAGIPGMGPVKARKLLEGDPLLWINSVKMAYEKQFGSYYGPIIYRETEGAITLMCCKHPYRHIYQQHEQYFHQVLDRVKSLTQ